MALGIYCDQGGCNTPPEPFNGRLVDRQLRYPVGGVAQFACNPGKISTIQRNEFSSIKNRSLELNECQTVTNMSLVCLWFPPGFTFVTEGAAQCLQFRDWDKRPSCVPGTCCTMNVWPRNVAESLMLNERRLFVSQLWCDATLKGVCALSGPWTRLPGSCQRTHSLETVSEPHAERRCNMHFLRFQQKEKYLVNVLPDLDTR